MANGINKFVGIGRLGKDPETRYMQNGNAVTSFSIAISETWKDKQSGEKQERTEWVNCTAFGKLGEICGEYLRKGSLVFVEGKLQTDKYEKDGITRYSTKVIAREMRMLDAKQDGQRSQQQPPQSSAPVTDDQDFDDDIPF